MQCYAGTPCFLCMSGKSLPFVWRDVCLSPNSKIRNIISVGQCQKEICSRSLLHMMTVYENLKSTIWRWRVVFPIKDMGDPSAILRCIAVVSILVLYWSSIMLYLLVYINEIVAPWSIRALKYFPAWTVTVEQAETSSVVNWCAGGFPPYLFESSSLLEEGSSSLKHLSHHPIQRKSPMQVLNSDLLLMLGSMGELLSVNVALMSSMYVICR